MSGVICTIYLFLYTLNLNIIFFLSVYLNFLWMKREREMLKSWTCPPIKPERQVPYPCFPNHRGNHSLYNFEKELCVNQIVEGAAHGHGGRRTDTFPSEELPSEMNWTICIF